MARDAGVTVLDTSRGPVRARWVVNAAGLGSDVLDRSFGGDAFTVTPRRGELIVFDKQARPLAPVIVLPVPSSRGKGVLIAPTVYGNVMLGPTAEDLDDKRRHGHHSRRARGVAGQGPRPHAAPARRGGHRDVRRAARGHRARRLPGAGRPRRGYLCLGGIRSTGLTASMALAEHAAALLAEAGLELRPRTDLPDPPRMPPLGQEQTRPYEDGARIEADPGVRRGGLLLRAHHPRRDPRRDGVGDPARRPRRPAAADPGDDGPLPGFRLRRPRRVAARRRAVTGVETAEVVVVGAGPAGLAAARELARAGVGRVVVLEREQEPGGIPRHSDHPGFGLRDLRRSLRGPEYARRLLDAAMTAGAEIRTSAMATGWAGSHTLDVTSPLGRVHLQSRAVVLATGARERPALGAADRRRPPARGPHHRAAAAARPPPRAAAAGARGHRRRRARVVVGGADPARRPAPPSP